MPGDISRQQVEDFLYYEARLLDDGKFEEWLELFTDDAVYWVPIGDSETDPLRDVSLIYDDRKRIGERVERVTSGKAHSQDPPSITRRIVGNVEIVEQKEDELTVISNFMIAEFRHDNQLVFAGRYEHTLATQGDTWRIRRKKVQLINNTQPLGNVTFFL